jgi:hypothetical protein
MKEAVAGEPDLRIVKTVHSSFHGDVLRHEFAEVVKTAAACT